MVFTCVSFSRHGEVSQFDEHIFQMGCCERLGLVTFCKSMRWWTRKFWIFLSGYPSTCPITVAVRVFEKLPPPRNSMEMLDLKFERHDRHWEWGALSQKVPEKLRCAPHLFQISPWFSGYFSPKPKTKRMLFAPNFSGSKLDKNHPFRSHSRVNAARGNSGYSLWGDVESVRTIVDIWGNFRC